IGNMTLWTRMITRIGTSSTSSSSCAAAREAWYRVLAFLNDTARWMPQTRHSQTPLLTLHGRQRLQRRHPFRFRGHAMRCARGILFSPPNFEKAMSLKFEKSKGGNPPLLTSTTSSVSCTRQQAGCSLRMELSIDYWDK